MMPVDAGSSSDRERLVIVDRFWQAAAAAEGIRFGDLPAPVVCIKPDQYVSPFEICITPALETRSPWFVSPPSYQLEDVEADLNSLSVLTKRVELGETKELVLNDPAFQRIDNFLRSPTLYLAVIRELAEHFRRVKASSIHVLDGLLPFLEDRYLSQPLDRRETDFDLHLPPVVRFGDERMEGTLIEAVSPAWDHLVRLFDNDPDLMFEIDPWKWEEILAASYERAGFDEVILTPRSGDLGREVIAIKHGMYSVCFFDQMKRFKKGHLVTANDVRAMLGVLSAFPNTSKGIVTTTSDFAPGVEKSAELKMFLPHRLKLVNGQMLLTHLMTLAIPHPE